MKAVKLAGIRLVNYIQDGINWKDHKSIVLDFWVSFKCRESGYSSSQFDGMYTVEELPTEVQGIYEEWFKNFDFQTEQDTDWLEFVNGTLNIFYHTKDPMEMKEGTWYVDLMQSEIKAREIVEEQLYHGNPNINAFWKIETNSKSEEVGGRRNGYIFSQPLDKITPDETRNHYWAVAYQCPETVKLTYIDKDEQKSKCINWAANCTHMTLLQIAGDGRFIIVPIFVKGKVWKGDRTIPSGNVMTKPLTGSGLLSYIQENFYNMYGIWDEVDEEVKEGRESSNQRKNAVNTMNDEEVKLSEVIDNVDNFIEDGNVSPQRRDQNKQIRQAVRDKNKLREREIKKKIRGLEKEKRKAGERTSKKLNALNI